MSAFYGARFADAWRGVDVVEVKAVWAEELAGYSIPEIQRGIANLKTRPFPPTLPEFLSLCRPKPEYQTAHAEACRLIGRLEGWSDCSVFWAARQIGHFDLKNQPYEKIAGRWRAALDRAWEHRLPIPEPEPVAALLKDEWESGVVLTDEQRERIRQRIANIGRVAKPMPVTAVEVQAAEAELAARGAAL